MKWKDIKVGDIIRLKKNTFVPVSALDTFVLYSYRIL